MQVTIWGCRGSLAAPGADTVRYGGNTSCVEVRLDDGTIIVLDAGTGLRALGRRLAAEKTPVIHLMLTHLHMDHLEGLGFFTPLFSPDVELHVWGPPSPTKPLEQRIARYLSPPLFPVHIQDVDSKPIFHDAPEEPWRIGSATILAESISHSGPTVGYRIEDNGHSLAYMPDHEPMLGKDPRNVEPEWLSGHTIANGADVLMHDSQYLEEEYLSRVGWGHSSIEHVVEYGRISKVGRLVLFHHDPLHTDEMLEAKLARALDIWGSGAGEPELAREGMQFEVA